MNGRRGRDPRAALRAPFEAFGGVWTEPEALQPLALILDLAGEAVRSRLLIVGGASEELALRPDFTIPITRRHIAAGSADGRYLYEGAAFRAPEAGAPAEFPQIGVEAFGLSGDPVLEDAAVAALGWASALAGGRDDLALHFGDVGLFDAFLGAVGAPEPTRARLTAVFANPALLRSELDGAEDGGAVGAEEGRLARLLSDLPEAEAARVLEELWVVAGITPVGGRSAAEITHRIAVRARARRAGPLGAAEARLIRRYLEIEAAPEAAIDRIEALAAEAGARLEPRLADWRRRLEALSAAGAPADRRLFSASFARPFSYYDGFLFEVRSRALGADAPVAAGGRYDALPQRLGGRPGAVGCMVRPDRALDTP